MARPRPRRRSLSSYLTLVLIACAAPQNQPLTIPRPDEIPALQRAFARDSTDSSVRLRLAEAQRRAGRLDVAVKLLEPVTDATPLAAFYLGLVREDQGRPADARQLYERYLSQSRSGQLRDRVRDRLTLLDRVELQQAVHAAVLNERTRPAPDGRTVGVFPFLTTTKDPALHSLGTALAELLTVDLAQTDRLRVLERARIQQLLNELHSSDTRRTDPATAVLSGRLLRAGTVVQGRLDIAADVSLQAFVVPVVQPTTTVNPLREREALTRLFDIEKKIALGIYDRMGIQLTGAERDRVAHQATRNVQALLELGAGLEAQDAGRYPDALARFERAVQLDRNFALAKERAATAQTQMRAAQISTATLAEMALTEIPVSVRSDRGDALQAVQRLIPNPGVRDASVEALGTEGLARHGTVDVVIRRPPGA